MTSAQDWKLTISTSQLRAAFDMLMDYLEQEEGRTEIVIHEDFFWELSNEACFDFTKAPGTHDEYFLNRIHVGSLAHDWERIADDVGRSPEDRAVTEYSFQWFGSVLRGYAIQRSVRAE